MQKTFRKKERLHSKKDIEKLFREGKSIKLYPLRLVYLPFPTGQTSQVLFSVPKKNFKRAVDRNRLKRQMREAYRLHKHLISYTQDVDIPFLLGYIYIAREKQTFQDIELVIKLSLKRLKQVKP